MTARPAGAGMGGGAVVSSLSTHVLDLSAGTPASGVEVRLVRSGGGGGFLFEGRTDRDGRARLADALAPGGYRIEFGVGPYFRGRGEPVGAPAFLEQVAIEFNLTDGHGHHHVPLLVSPYGYSTYRGS